MNISEILKKIATGEIKEFNIQRSHESDRAIIEIRSNTKKASHTFFLQDIEGIHPQHLNIIINKTVEQTANKLKSPIIKDTNTPKKTMVICKRFTEGFTIGEEYECINSVEEIEQWNKTITVKNNQGKFEDLIAFRFEVKK